MAVLTLNVTGSQTPTITDSTDRSAFASESAESSCFSVDCDYAGGNIIVDRLEGDHVYVHQDLRDMIGNWFYWNFRVKICSRPLSNYSLHQYERHRRAWTGC